MTDKRKATSLVVPRTYTNAQQRRDAITKTRGGWENATDEQINEIWHALTAEQKAAAIAAVDATEPTLKEQDNGDQSRPE